jgi:hypothetical protein
VVIFTPEQPKPEPKVEVVLAIPLYAVILISLFCAGVVAGAIVLVLFYGKRKQKELPVNTVYVEESPESDSHRYLVPDLEI